MINSNVTTISLDGTEITVEFSKGYPYYQITNKGDTDIYVSLSPNIIPEAEGVYTVSAGGTERIGEGYPIKKFYILGTSKTYIRGEQIAAPTSFRLAGKGGEDGGVGSAAKPVNYIQIYGTDVQGIGDIRIDYKHPLTKSGIENLCVTMSCFAKYRYSNDYNYHVLLSDNSDECISPFNDHVMILPYNYADPNRPTIMSLIITEPDK